METETGKIHKILSIFCFFLQEATHLRVGKIISVVYLKNRFFLLLFLLINLCIVFIIYSWKILMYLVNVFVIYDNDFYLSKANLFDIIHFCLLDLLKNNIMVEDFQLELMSSFYGLSDVGMIRWFSTWMRGIVHEGCPREEFFSISNRYGLLLRKTKKMPVQGW